MEESLFEALNINYTLYYLNQYYQIQTIEVSSLSEPILIPEDLIFTNIRKGVKFIKEPHSLIKLTHLERLIMSTEFFDMENIRESDFRKANTYLEILTPVYIDEIKPSETEQKFYPFEGRRGQKVTDNYYPDVFSPDIENFYSTTENIAFGTSILDKNKVLLQNENILTIDTQKVLVVRGRSVLAVLEYEDIPVESLKNPLHTRNLLKVLYTANQGDIVTFQYLRSDGTKSTQKIEAKDKGQRDYYTFIVFQDVVESSLQLHGGNVIQYLWNDY